MYREFMSTTTSADITRLQCLNIDPSTFTFLNFLGYLFIHRYVFLYCYINIRYEIIDSGLEVDVFIKYRRCFMFQGLNLQYISLKTGYKFPYTWQHIHTCPLLMYLRCRAWCSAPGTCRRCCSSGYPPSGGGSPDDGSTTPAEGEEEKDYSKWADYSIIKSLTLFHTTLTVKKQTRSPICAINIIIIVIIIMIDLFYCFSLFIIFLWVFFFFFFFFCIAYRGVIYVSGVAVKDGGSSHLRLQFGVVLLRREASTDRWLDRIQGRHRQGACRRCHRLLQCRPGHIQESRWWMWGRRRWRQTGHDWCTGEKNSIGNSQWVL